MSTIQPAAESQPMPSPVRRRIEPRDFLAFGTGVGIQIGDRDLEVVLVRVRPSGARILATHTIEGFRERPAAEWGVEYAAFLAEHGGSHLAATVLLPRHEVIVRHIALPGVPDRDLGAALGYQIESLHPFGDEEIAHAWMRLGTGGALLVGIVRKQLLDGYAGLFTEAGVATASFTFSAAVLYSASRLLRRPAPGGCLAYSDARQYTVELYGESPAKAVFSAEFDASPERAALLARAELRLGEEVTPQPMLELLAPPVSLPPDYDLSRNALAYATALAGACPRLAPAANLLPPERRASSSRAMYVPTIVLAAILAVLVVTGIVSGKLRDRSYLAALETEISRVEPQARRAASLDAEIARTRARIRLLDDFRLHSKADLDALNELTRLLAPPIWASSVELTRDALSIGGEAEQAAALLQLLDRSPFFQNSAFAMPIARGANVEIFRIRAEREGRR